MSGTQVTQSEAGGSPPPGTTNTDPPPHADADVEARARRMGWQPREQYRGDPNLWQEPAAFVERAETMLPLAVARNRALERQVETLTNESVQNRQLLTGLVERTRRAEEIGYKRARREIERERAQAVAAGDTEGFNAAEERLRELGPEPEAAGATTRQPAATPTPTPTPPASTAQPGMDPVVEAWIGQNPWFRSNPEANAVAVALHGVVSNQNPNWSLEEKLAETTRRVRQRMPELFGQQQPPGDPPPANPRRSAPPAVSGSQSAGNRAVNPRSFDAMPADVKKEYDRQVKMLAGKGEPFTKDEFAQYYWDQFEETA